MTKATLKERIGVRWGAALRLVRDLRRAAFVRLTTFPALAITLLVALGGGLASPEIGEHINRILFYDPYMIARSRLGASPPVSPKLALVVLDDRSLTYLQRAPTFAEWRAVTRVLGRYGVRTALLLEPPYLSSELGTDEGAADGPALFAAAVASPRALTARVISAGDVPRRLLLAFGPPAPRKPGFLLTPAPAIFAALSGLGEQAPPDGHRVTSAQRLGDGSILPALPLRAATQLAWREGRLFDGATPVPTSHDGSIYVDYPDLRDVLARAISVMSFFDGNARGVSGVVSERVAAQLEGVEVALLVPNGYSGARFVDAPDRKVPSYVATAALASGVLRGAYVWKPVPIAWVAVAFTLLMLTLALRAPTRVCVGTALLLAVGTAVAGVWALASRGWVLPVAPVVLLSAVAALLRAGRHLISTMRDRMRLERDLELGKAVQSMLLPEQQTGRIGRWEYRITSRPYGPMSGDWFQIAVTPPDAPSPAALLAIGDVVGKGPSAALLTAAIAAFWNEHCEAWLKDGLDVDQFCTRLDALIHRTFRGVQNTTLSLAVLSDEGVLLLCIGAPRWVALAADTGVAEDLRTAPANPLGMGGNDRKYPCLRLTADSVGVLMAFTDGVLDGHGPRARLRRSLAEVARVGRAMAEDSGRDQSAVSASTGTVDELARLDALLRGAGADEVQPDDATTLVIRRVA